MIGAFCILSLVAAAAVGPAAAADMEGLMGARMGREFSGTPVAITETKFVSTGARPMASGRSLWSSEAKMGGAASAWGSDAEVGSGRAAAWRADSAMSGDKMMASGRSLWAGPSAMRADEKVMYSGRSLLNTDDRMVATGRSAWKSEGAHLHKDAQPAIPILQQEYEMNDPTSYAFSYKTANGIAAQEQAAMKSEDAEAVQGVYSWVSPSGEKFAVEYVADETGYHAKGAHIPEMPRAISRSLEWNAAHPEEEDGRAAAAWESESSSGSAAWGSSAKSSGASWASSAKIEAAPAWTSSAKLSAASGRSAWGSESAALPAWKSESSAWKWAWPLAVLPGSPSPPPPPPGRSPPSRPRLPPPSRWPQAVLPGCPSTVLPSRLGSRLLKSSRLALLPAGSLLLCR
ncbi:Cuticle Protein CPR RR-1 18 [Frankliniella occidentalis]|nr:Cuticle Protein CPR RR-1 18 [Frankliniella occidentalis]